MSSSVVEPGTKLAERFRLEDRVHESDGATLWKAIDEVLARPVAVYTFDPGFPRLEQVISAARVASRLTDPRLTQVFDATTEDDGRSYVVSEWVSGETLTDMVAAGPLEPERAAALVAEAAEALAHAHEAGLAHLCLTPEHLVWTAAGSTVKVLGLGTDAALMDVTSEDAARADTEGLGRLLYAGLTGHWAGEEDFGLPPAPLNDGQLCTPRQVTAGVPGYLDAIACRALLSEVKRGMPPFATPAELAEALSAVPRPVPVPTPMPVAPPPVTASRSDGVDTASPQRPAPQIQHVQHRPPPAQGGGMLGKVAMTAIVLLVMAAVGVGAWTIGRSIGNAGTPTAGVTVTPTQPVPVETREVKPKSVTGFDPFGADGEERPELALNAVDSKSSTDWHSESYTSADFGNLKKGVGLLLDLGQSVPVKQVTVDFGNLSPSGTVELRIGDSADLGGLKTVHKFSGLTGKKTYSADSTEKGRYVLIWFTKLPPYQGMFRGSVFDVKVTAVK
ncbi:protein kinase family protein [Streptosporangium sp. NPDC000239]|uniref:Protein kinase family protein n=1 Tax=Streptosporangium jomthongense TaxID=1193683 RepID=A0ABV8F3Z2_9ACTN